MLIWTYMTPAHGKSSGGERGEKRTLRKRTCVIVSDGKERNRERENYWRVGERRGLFEPDGQRRPVEVATFMPVPSKHPASGCSVVAQ